MLSSELDFALPPELIAQYPIEPRDHSRLMHLRRADGTIEHRRFDSLPQLLQLGDLLVLNDTRVLRARLHGHKMNEAPDGEATQGARVEALLLREIEPNVWEALLRPSARLRLGTPILFTSPDGGSSILARPVERTASGWLVRFESESAGDIREALPHLGEVPLPPYISAKLREEADYQTVYAKGGVRPLAGETLESSAAPTAGLHFTPRVFEALATREVNLAYVTLGIGIGTFRPIQAETVEAHAMHEEEYEISEATATAINAQKRRGGRIVAVGTTTTRVLESAAALTDATTVNGSNVGEVVAGAGRTSIYIRPGHRFRIVDALLTNFHLPRSTLLVMIAAFAQDMPGETGELAGLQKIRYAYTEAIRERYRFFSFGDAMFIE